MRSIMLWETTAGGTRFSSRSASPMNRVPESIGARRLSPKWNVAGGTVRAVPVTLDFVPYCLSWSPAFCQRRWWWWWWWRLQSSKRWEFLWAECVEYHLQDSDDAHERRWCRSNVDISRLPVALRMLEGQASVGQRRSFVEMDLFRVGRWGQVHAVAGCIESAKRFRLCGSASRGSLYSMCNGQVGRRWRFVGIAVSADPA